MMATEVEYPLVLHSHEDWKQLETVMLSKGYSLCYPYVTEPRPLDPRIDLTPRTFNSFYPYRTPEGSYVHSVRKNHSSYFAGGDNWMTSHSRIIYAYDNLNRRLIIKAITPSKNESEIEIITHLNYPRQRSSPYNHTIPLIEQFRSGGWHFIVMPVWNMTFAPYLVWQVDDYFERSIQCLEGLDFMHDHGIAHRNICIRNIVYNQDGTQESATLGCRLQPVISKWDVQLAYIDFGTSRKFPINSDPASWVLCDSTDSSPFMAPEVVKAMEGEFAYRALPADVYSLASVWKYAITGEQKLITYARQYNLECSRERTYALEVLQQKVPQYISLIDNMLHKDPEKRPTAKEALATLKSIRKRLPGKFRFTSPNGYSKIG